MGCTSVSTSWCLNRTPAESVTSTKMVCRSPLAVRRCRVGFGVEDLGTGVGSTVGTAVGTAVGSAPPPQASEAIATVAASDITTHQTGTRIRPKRCSMV